MMTRRPLIPWISARTSSSQSQVRQNGLCHRSGDEPEVHAVHPVVEHVHDQDVPDGEDQQHDAR